MSPRLDLGPNPHLGYTESRVDRAAELRLDDAALNALAADSRARRLCGRRRVDCDEGGRAGAEPLFTLDEAHALGPATETVFLGLEDGAPASASACLRRRRKR